MTRSRRGFRLAHWSALVLCLSALTPPLRAQTSADLDPQRYRLDRAELRQMLVRFEELATAATTADARRRAADEAGLVRRRLELGDFAPGDQVVVRVDGEAEMSDTFVVSVERTLLIPGVGSIPLTGVLRAELEPHLGAHVARFVRDPVLSARSLLRITVQGAVARPGFYVVPAESLLGELIMVAGGPAATADLQRVSIMRGDDRIWDGPATATAIAEGRTIDQMSLRAGDRVVLPELRTGFVGSVFSYVVALVPAAGLALSLLLR